MVDCVCDPLVQHGHRFSQFIGNTFSVCAYTPRDIAGFICGLINIGFWLFAQSPQLVVTYKQKNPGNISLSFLLIWLVGDFCNLIGCILTNQSKVQLYTSIYFIIMDCLVLAQILYYAKIYKKPTPPGAEGEGHSHGGKQCQHKHIEESDDDDLTTPLSPRDAPKSEVNFLDNNSNSQASRPSARAAGGSAGNKNTIFGTPAVAVSIAVLGLVLLDHTEAATPFTALSNTIKTTAQGVATMLSTADAPICNSTGDLSAAVQLFGTVCSWICGFLYFTARIPQCVKNYKEKSTRGISFALFMMSFIANLFYAISILVPTTTNFRSVGFWKDTFPFLIGSLGANVFSAIVMVQFWIYPSLPEEDEEEGAAQGNAEACSNNTCQQQHPHQHTTSPNHTTIVLNHGDATPTTGDPNPHYPQEELKPICLDKPYQQPEPIERVSNIGNIQVVDSEQQQQQEQHDEQQQAQRE